MKRIIAALTLAALPALSACGGADEVNQASQDDINRLATSNENLTTDFAPAEPAMPAETNMPAEPDHEAAAEPRTAEKSATPPRERPAPPAKARPAPPPTDPHAGHDMGNMANMSH